MLQFIAHVRATHLGARHISTAEVRYAEALVLLQAGRREEARSLLASSLEVFLEHLVSPALAVVWCVVLVAVVLPHLLDARGAADVHLLHCAPAFLLELLPVSSFVSIAS